MFTDSTITRILPCRRIWPAVQSFPFPFPYPYPTVQRGLRQEYNYLVLNILSVVWGWNRERARERARVRNKMAGGGYRPDSVPRRVASIHLGRALPHGSSSQPGDLTHQRWDARTGNPRPPYLALLRMGFTVPPPFPEERCALTAPFHPYPRPIGGGLLSAALSLALPRPGVTRHAVCRGVRTFL